MTAEPPHRTVGVAERRARSARRHAIAPAHRRDRVEDACAAVVALHGTDPVGVYLAAAARVRDPTADDLDRALYTDRSLVKQMAMRRTLFVLDRDRLPVVVAATAPRVVHTARRDLLRDVARAALHPDPERWLDETCAEVVAVLADGRERSLDELREAVPGLRGAIDQGGGTAWAGRLAVGPRVLTVLAAQGRVVRARNRGHWRTSRHGWASMAAWPGTDPTADPPPTQEAVTALVRWWLAAFGPGTADDLRWWLGSTLRVVRTALGVVGAVPVDLDGTTGYLLPDDLAPEEPVEPWAALLPVLDPTVMGWRGRAWFLRAYDGVGGRVLDTVGNAGPTVWWDGRVVGTWFQQAPDPTVRLELFEPVPAAARRLLVEEAQRIESFCEGTAVVARYP